MKRLDLTPREHLPAVAEQYGFDFYIIEGEKYWDETKAYQFTLNQIEKDIEDPTKEIHGMLMEATGRVVRDEFLLRRFAIPELVWGAIEKCKDAATYGRLDLRYDGNGPAKLLEANYDTPTSLFEAAVFQWDWLEELKQSGTLGPDVDQFNSIHEKLIVCWKDYKQMHSIKRLHLAGVLDAPEDKYTLQYMQDVAHQAGLDTVLLDIKDVGIGTLTRDGSPVLTDLDDEGMEALFKLYPWEHMFREEFAKHIASVNTRFIEPVWKSIISNKAMLPLLWEMYPNHPNLLPAYWTETKDCVRKAFFSREGSNILLPTGEHTEEAEFSGGYIWQEFCPLPKFGSDYPVIGSWVIGSEPAGIGIREDDSLITKNTSRFVPHFIKD